ncbi:hypothetical protein [Streptomyces sp. NPDC058335]|uniref:hypothetical protein n=1 Tax=Streptomyces sp. NPDC058335 TaxID=3346451 RepID=UPI003660ECA9
MGNVLTTASTVTCQHAPSPLPEPPVPGMVSVSSEAKLKVEGEPVLVETSVLKSVSGCPNTAAGAPCTQVAAVQDGRSQKLRAGGVPVLLHTLEATTNAGSLAKPTPHQTKLTSV